jgi:hypothetical protein
MKKTIYITTLALAVVLIFSCKKLEDFGHTNTNPAATNNPITSALLTNVLASTATGYGTFSTTWAGPALYCQYFSETQYPDFSCYASNSATPMGIYSGALYDLQNIIKNNTDAATKDVAALSGANENQIAIARILKAYIFWTITDRWGDVPYKDALQGNPNVAFDSQESIYKDLIKELTEAVAQFSLGGAAIKGDIAYDGDVTKWQKLANSLRMLMALRLSKQYPTASEYAATQFKAALADAAGSIATNADNFMLTYPGGNFKNPFYSMYDGRKDYGESATMTALMATLNNDTRQSVFGATATGVASTLGVPYGRARSYIDPWCGANPTYCYVFHPNFRQQTSPLYIVKASSVLLARAEAADRGWTTETANTNTLYQAGITASYTQWGLSAPAAAYLTHAAVALPSAFGTGANISFIATQQYVAYFPDGMQGWSNWRRTNYPALLPAPDGTNVPKVIPRRYMYGTTDYSLAKVGTEAAVALMSNGDKMDSKVWWDK